MNKHKIKYIIGCAVGLIATASCSNSEYDYDHLFPEEYHKIVYINDETDESFVIYDADEPHTDTITVFKAGSHPQLEADINLQNCTAEEMDSLGKNYTVLPSNCYKVDAPVHFAPDVRYAKIGITYDLEAVKSFIATADSTKPVALALQLTSDNSSVNQEKQWYFRRITVEQPVLSFVTSEDNSSMTLPMTTTEADITTQLSIQNKWEFSINISTADAEADVAAYNAANGTSYRLLPSGSYSFANKELRYASGTSVASTRFNYDAGSLDITGVYMLPVRITDCTMHGFLEPTEPLYIIIDPKVTLTTGMLSSPCTEPSEGSLYNLIDNNASTFWHSVWSIRYYNDTYRHYFDVHLDAPLKRQLRFDYSTRDYWPVLPLDITIFVSADGQNWTKLVDIDKDRDNLPGTGSVWTSPVYDLPFEINYFRFSIFRSNQGECGLTGSSAAVAITGFDLWGK